MPSPSETDRPADGWTEQRGAQPTSIQGTSRPSHLSEAALPESLGLPVEAASIEGAETTTAPVNRPTPLLLAEAVDSAPRDASADRSLAGASQRAHERLAAGLLSDQQAPSWPVRLIRWLAWALQWLFGLASLIVVLAVLATVPILQFLSLGYLLEASGRVARTGRLRDGFIGIPRMAKLGSLIAGTLLVLLPVWYLSGIWYASNLIDHESGMTVSLRTLQLVFTVLIVGHIVASWYCGGRLRHFFWPLVAPFQLVIWKLRHFVATGTLRPILNQTVGRVSPRLVNDICSLQPLKDWFVPAILIEAFQQGQMYARSRDAVWDFVVSLRLRHYLWLGLRGFWGALAWLLVPIILMMGATTIQAPGVAGLSGVLGTLLLAGVVMYLPFLQAQFAMQNRLGAMFEIRTIRRCFARAPIAFWIALAASLLLAVPLYFLKIELTPAELTWLPSLIFVIFIFPARLLAGWALGRAQSREDPRYFLFRWSSRLAVVPVALAYAIVVFVSQYTLWHGKWGLFEQHAFLVPVPFVGG